MSFKDVIKELRTAQNLTQRQFAQKLGVSQNAISMYENGKREPDMKMLSMMAEFFQVDMNYLLCSNPKKPPTQSNSNSLNERDQRDIAKKMRSMLELFDSDEALMFDGEALDDETRELLKESYRNQLEMTKRLAKIKYNPNK